MRMYVLLDEKTKQLIVYDEKNDKVHFYEKEKTKSWFKELSNNNFMLFTRSQAIKKRNELEAKLNIKIEVVVSRIKIDLY